MVTPHPNLDVGQYHQFVLVIFPENLYLTSVGHVCQQRFCILSKQNTSVQLPDSLAGVGVVCEQTFFKYAEHTKKSSRQPDLFDEVDIICQQTVPYAKHTVCLG